MTRPGIFVEMSTCVASTRPLMLTMPAGKTRRLELQPRVITGPSGCKDYHRCNKQLPEAFHCGACLCRRILMPFVAPASTLPSTCRGFSRSPSIRARAPDFSLT